MLRLPPIIVCFLSCVVFQSQAQTKVVGECAITYDIHQISNIGDTSLIGQKQIFIKGNSCKTILKTPQLTQTINGPAAIILAMFFNAAIDQACEQYITEQKMWPAVNKKLNAYFNATTRPVYHDFDALKKQSIQHNGLGLKLLGVSGDQVLDPKVYATIKKQVLQNVRGTLQADILKEDQAQNTCIFSIDFALKLMGDVQAYFVDQKVKNFYSISISGYHIAEAGANPITQLAFTLANGFTYIEYFLNRGLAIDDFIPNFSFFFSTGHKLRIKLARWS